MGIGKKRLTVESGIYSVPGFEVEVDASELLSGETDPIRFFAGKSWTSQGNNIVYGIPSTEAYSIEFEDDLTEQESGGVFPTTTQTIRLVPNPSRELFQSGDDKSGFYFDTIKWDFFALAFITNYVTAKDQIPYTDCPFEYNVPFKYDETAGIAIDNVATLVADIEPEYNFYVNGYENKLARAPEKIMPCMYSFISEKESEYTDSDNSLYNQHISLMNNILGVYKDIVNNQGERTGERDVSIADYFKTWGAAWNNRVRNNLQIVTPLLNNFRNIIFSQVDVDFLNSFSWKKEMFPMDMIVKFSTGAGTKTADVIREVELSADLISYVQNSLNTRVNFIESREFVSRDTGELDSILKSNASYHMWDTTSWWQTVGQERDLRNSIIFGRNKCNETRILDDCRPQMANLLKVLMLGKIRDLIKEHNRSPKEIFEDGKIARSETIFYQVDKYKGNQSNFPIQSFYVPNSNELGICELIDTQVKYNTPYKYKIHAYQMVYGVKYQYAKETSDYIDAATGGYVTIGDVKGVVEAPRFKVTMEPYLKLVRVPYFESPFMKIVDSPPVAPDVDVIPYRGISNKILFNFNANVGNLDLVPEIIEAGEQQLITELELVQKVSPGDLINYASDDPPKLFQVYRLNYKPESYRDFSGNMIKEISTQKDTVNLSAVSYVDTVEPNRKYYYTFRSIDVHDHLSYPSPVFEIEMVEADGAVYLLMDTIKLEKTDSRVPSKIMNKHILISPSFPHRIVDLEKTILNAQSRQFYAGTNLDRFASHAAAGTPGLVTGIPINSAKQLSRNDVVLGVAEHESIWGKNFKFRFTSKNTGRKFDLNVKFKHIFNYDNGETNT